MSARIVVVIAFGMLITGCSSHVQQQKLTSIQIHDRNGFQETISSPERLKMFSAADFSQPQVYQKIVRTYKRGEDGKTKTVLTAYHENGLLKQYLEGENGRARGMFREYYEDGRLKVEATVIEGVADFQPDAMQKWMFDGLTKAWDEQGALRAEIPYEKGSIKGDAFYYHANGEVRKVVPYLQGVIHGTVKEYDTYGSLLAEISYRNGDKHGSVAFLGSESIPPYSEEYDRGKIVQGAYHNPDGAVESRVEDGEGIQVFYEDGVLRKKISISSGKQEGPLWLYSEKGTLSSSFSLKDGEKHGIETVFYGDSTPKLTMHWHEGEVIGNVKTWYLNGTVQSEMEMHNNLKHGMSVAWYEDGNLMLVEEYEKGKLVSGKYFKQGEETPVSKIVHGDGTATLYDKGGVLLEKVVYQDGIPEQE